MAEAQKCLAQFGIRKTTVDELVRRVGIPKGTFYLLYESKDRLLFDVILKFNDDVQDRLLKEIVSHSEPMDADSLTNIIIKFYQQLDQSFFPRIVQDGELEFFMRTLPPELSKLHAEHDAFAVRQMFSMIPWLSNERAEVYGAALRSMFLTLLFKDEIGADQYEETLRLLIRGVVMQLLQENERTQLPN